MSDPELMSDMFAPGLVSIMIPVLNRKDVIKTAIDSVVTKSVPAMDILDVGANVGLYCVAIAGLVPGIKGIAFEPGGQNFQQLSEKVRRNGRDQQIELFQLGLSDAPIQHRLACSRTGGNKRSANAAMVDDWSSAAPAWKDGDFKDTGSSE